MIHHHLWMDRDNTAIELANEALARGRKCINQPQGIRSAIMLPLVRQGRLEEARHAFVHGYRKHRNEPGVCWSIANYLEFCARTGNEARGLEILNRHLRCLDEPDSPAGEMWFSVDAALLLRRMQTIGQRELKITRPAYGDRSEAVLTAAELRVVLENRATALAAQFDARNRNTSVSEQVAAELVVEPVIDRLVLVRGVSQS